MLILDLKKPIEFGILKLEIWWGTLRKRNEQLNYMRLASRLDVVVARLDTQAEMMIINKSMISVVRALDIVLASNNHQNMSETMDQFES